MGDAVDKFLLIADRAAAAMEGIAVGTGTMAGVARKIDAVIEAAGGVEGIKQKLKLLDGLSSFASGFGRFGKK